MRRASHQIWRTTTSCLRVSASAILAALLLMSHGAYASSILIPKVERISKRAPNAPYVVRGVAYKPLNMDVPFKQRGMASWYGGKFHGRLTASGETYDKYAMTAAHPTLPLPSYVRVRHIRSGREVIVRVNDRGPFHGRRIIDLSRAAATELGVQNSGTAEVEIERLTFDDIRAGKWKVPSRLDADDTAVATSPSSPTSTESAENLSAMTEQADDSATLSEAPHWLKMADFTVLSEAEEARKNIAKQWGQDGEEKFRLIQLDHSISVLMGPFVGAIDAAVAAREVRTRLQLTPTILQ